MVENLAEYMLCPELTVEHCHFLNAKNDFNLFRLFLTLLAPKGPLNSHAPPPPLEDDDTPRTLLLTMAVRASRPRRLLDLAAAAASASQGGRGGRGCR